MLQINLDPILPLLSERHREWLPRAVAKMQDGISAGRIKNMDFVGAKETISRAVEEGAKAFLDTGPHEKKHTQSDWWLAAYHANAFISGAYNVPAALKRAQKAAITEYAAFIASALLPMHELIETAKPLIVKRQPGEKTEKQLAAEAARAGREMTCQCCGRGIFAETGVIAHHGYERPSEGWQTASCMGARHLPFEVDRAVLGEMIDGLVDQISRTEQNIAAVEREAVSLSFDYDRPNPQRWGRAISHWVEVTRDTFDMVKEAYRLEMQYRATSFDDLKARKIADLEGRHKRLTSWKNEAQKRFDGWRQTHRWDGGQKAWVAL